MASRDEIMASTRRHDAHALRDAARVVRRRKPDVSPTTVGRLCSILTTLAEELEAGDDTAVVREVVPASISRRARL